MSKILVTGGTGYIGSHTVIELLAAGHDVEIVDNLYNSKITVLDKIEQIAGIRPEFHQADLLDTEALDGIFAKGNFDAVLHFAGLKAVAESVEKPLKYYGSNITGTVNLLECMQKYKVNRIVFSSSATVYGVQETTVYAETMETGRNITNPYGRTKYMIEEIMKDVANANPNFQAIILRYFNPIGAHPSGLLGEDPNDKPNNLMPIIMHVALGDIAELNVCGNDYPTPDGTCVRDYIHVVDLAKGHLSALEKSPKDEQIVIYNLGSGKGTSVLEMVDAFSRASGKPLPHKIAPRRAGDLPEFYANPAKAAAELGWQTTQTIDDAMHDTINFLSASCGLVL